MCSHYKPVTHINQLRNIFGLGPLTTICKPDMWPGYEGLFIRPHPHADVGDEAVPDREAVSGHWGLIPHWSKDGKVRGTFNARSETIAEKPTFRDAWRKAQRCIIPAISVFEPDWRSGKAVAAEVSRADGEPMGIAGLWSAWRSPTGWVESTTTPLAIAYATTSASTGQALSATITPSAPPSNLATSINFNQTT